MSARAGVKKPSQLSTPRKASSTGYAIRLCFDKRLAANETQKSTDSEPHTSQQGSIRSESVASPPPSEASTQVNLIDPYATLVRQM